jgi:ribosomal protein S18 acetylase RimI-like enzyme
MDLPFSLNSKIQFRPVQDSDIPLLRKVYASSREDEMGLVPEWSKDQKDTFLAQQFDAQHAHYTAVYPNADFLVILISGEPAGRIYIQRGTSDIRIIDIALLPAFRGHGYGGIIIKNLQKEAAEKGKTVSIHVEKFNRALALYERLGFRKIEDTHGIYLLMKWNPDNR